MKKFLKIFGGIILFLVALLIIVPYFFKDKIFEKVKTEMNNMLDAKVEIGNLSLSMLKSFPNLHLELKDICITGKNEFESDTLAFVGRLYTSVDLSSALSGTEIELGAVVLDHSKIKAKVLETGKANWNIVKSSEEEVIEKEEELAEASNFNIIFKEVNVNNFKLIYDDASLKTIFEIGDLELRLRGNFSEKSTRLDLTTTCRNVNLDYENTNYLNDVELQLTAGLEADLEEMIFKFLENSLEVNQLKFEIDGQVAIADDAYNMDLNMEADKTDFKSLLAMIPDVFKSEMEGMETNGQFKLTAFAKGEYREGSFPEFGATLKVNEASFKYKDLPEQVENIRIDAQLKHPGGNLDLMQVDVNDFHVELANNPFDAELHIRNLMTDPHLSGFFKGLIDFSKIPDAIPMDSVKITGRIVSDVLFNGNYSAIEKEEYEKFTTKGKVVLHDFVFTTPDFPQGVKIVKSELNFTPRYITLNSFNSQIGQSDIRLKGKLENYIPYLMKGKTLKGKFDLSSNMINLNEFMSEAPETPVSNETSSDTVPLSVIEIPANVDIKLTSHFNTVRFDKMNIENVKGLIEVNNSKAKLTNLSMNMLKGTMAMNGTYSTLNLQKPEMDFALDVNEFDVNAAYHSLSMIKEMIPIAMNCEGSFSSDMKIEALLDQEMNPIPSTLNGKGALHSRGLLIKDNKAFNALAVALKNDDYKRISVTQFDLEFEITNGNIRVKPFATKIAGKTANIYGTQSVDGNLDFTMEMKLPKEDLGSALDKYFKQIPGLSNVPEFDVAVKITGTVDNPVVKPDLSKAIKQAQKAVVKELEKQAKDKLKEKGKDLLDKLFK